MEFLRRLYYGINRWTNAAFLCFAIVMGIIMLLAYTNGWAAAAPSADAAPAPPKKFPPIVLPDEPGIHLMNGPAPNTVNICRSEAGEDGIHVCQIWLMTSRNTGIPASPKVYCFVAVEKEVIHEGVPRFQQGWRCGAERAELSEERKAIGPIKLRRRPKKGEVSI